MTLMLILIVSYFLGAIPNGLIFGRLIWNVDLRQHGSGNIGATNAWRTIGKPAGLLIFALDFLKGFISVWLAATFVQTPISMIAAGLIAILGHSLSIFLKFKGGKGVATGLGVVAMLMPKVTLIVFATWLIIVLITRYVSLGSVIASALVPILAFAFDYPVEFIIFGLIAAAFIIFRHRSNIIRLKNGNENKV